MGYATERETGSGPAMLGILLLAVFFAANVKAEGLRAPYTIAATQDTAQDASSREEVAAGRNRLEIPAASALRLEGALGTCRRGLAPDASWSYREWGSYETKMELNPACYQVGLSYLPLDWDGVKVGIKFGFANLGRVTADNTYPIDEPAYFRAKDTRTAVQSGTGRFHGYGTAKGFTLGLAAETHWYIFDVGAEGGFALLRSTWRVNLPGFGSAVLTGCRQDWACADGNQITPYFGVNARWRNLFVSLRQYTSVHASNADKNLPYAFQFIGPTCGPVTQLTFGASVEL